MENAERKSIADLPTIGITVSISHAPLNGGSLVLDLSRKRDINVGAYGMLFDSNYVIVGLRTLLGKTTYGHGIIRGKKQGAYATYHVKKSRRKGVYDVSFNEYTKGGEHVARHHIEVKGSK